MDSSSILKVRRRTKISNAIFISIIAIILLVYGNSFIEKYYLNSRKIKNKNYKNGSFINNTVNTIENLASNMVNVVDNSNKDFFNSLLHISNNFLPHKVKKRIVEPSMYLTSNTISNLMNATKNSFLFTKNILENFI